MDDRDMLLARVELLLDGEDPEIIEQESGLGLLISQVDHQNLGMWRDCIQGVTIFSVCDGIELYYVAVNSLYHWEMGYMPDEGLELSFVVPHAIKKIEWEGLKSRG